MKRLITPVVALIVIVAAAAIPASGADGSPPANDNFAAAQELEGPLGSIDGYNIGATKELGEPAHAGNAGGASVWYTWTAPEDGLVELGAHSESWYEDVGVLGVYTGDSVDALTEVGSDVGWWLDEDYSSWHAILRFSVVGGTTYRIAFDSYEGETGSFDLWFRLYPYAENDDFANALTIEGLTGSVTGARSAATLEPGEPNHGRGPIYGIALRGSVWYRWTAPATRYVRFDTPHHVGAVYTGTAVDALTRVAQSKFNPILAGYSGPRALSFRAQIGTTYSIAIATDYVFMFPFPGESEISWYPGKVVIGTPKGDVLRGTPGPDLIDGRRGTDVLYGLGGNDLLFGGLGGDRLYGGRGADRIIGYWGADRLYGGPGRDRLNSRDWRRGNDAIYGGTGSDTARADPRDLIRGVP